MYIILALILHESGETPSAREEDEDEDEDEDDYFGWADDQAADGDEDDEEQ